MGQAAPAAAVMATVGWRAGQPEGVARAAARAAVARGVVAAAAVARVAVARVAAMVAAAKGAAEVAAAREARCGPACGCLAGRSHPGGHERRLLFPVSNSTQPKAPSWQLHQ